MVKGTIGSMGDRLEPGTIERLMQIHFGTKQCTFAPVRKKQRSDPKIMSNGLPEYMTDDYIAEMKLWKKKEIFAKLEDEEVHDFKEGWNRSLLVDHLVESLKNRNTREKNETKQVISRPVPPPSSFQTAPPPQLRVNVARAVARREQNKPSLLTTSKSSRKIKEQIAASNPTKVLKVPKTTVEESAKQTIQDVVMDDVEEDAKQSQSSQINDTQELLRRLETNEVAESEKARPEPLVSSPKRPTSPSIQPGLVSSAKKSYMQHLQKSHASPVKYPLFNPTPKLKPQAQKAESPPLSLPVEPMQKNAEPVLAAKKLAEDIHFEPTMESTSDVQNDARVPSTAPVKGMVSSSTKVARQPPYKSKKLALAAQMRAQNIEKLPGVSAAQPSSSLQHGLSKSASSKLGKVKKVHVTKPLTGSRFTKPLSYKKKKISSKSLKKPPLPSSFESYELTDTEGPDYDSEDSFGLQEQRATKITPSWARSKRLNPALDFQQTSCTIDPDSLFGRVTTCDLNNIFNRDSPRLQQRRRGSGDWSPIAPMKVSSSQLRHHATAGAC